MGRARAILKGPATFLTRRQAAVVAAILLVGAVSAGVALLLGGTAAAVISIGMQVLTLLAVFTVRLDLIQRYRASSTSLEATLSEVRASLAQLQDVSPMHDVLEVVGQDRVETMMRLESLQSSQKASASSLSDLSQKTESLASAMGRLSAQVRLEAQQRVTDMWSLVNLQPLLPVDGVLPTPGGWALSPNTLLELLSLLPDRREALIVECGSGVSTVWVAAALRRQGSGRVVALEHDPVFAEKTQADLHRLGLEPWADVRLAPLREVQAGAHAATPWYEERAVQDLSNIDLLLVDGPPGSTAPMVRFPAWPLLARAMRTGGVVILDDVDRPDERRIQEEWLSLGVAGRRLIPMTRTDRSQIFSVSAEGSD